MRTAASLGWWEPGEAALDEDPSGAATRTVFLVDVAGHVTRYRRSRFGLFYVRLCTEVLACS